MLNESTGECFVDNKCSELNYGKDEITAEWYESERLSLYSVMDKEFGIGTEKRDLINRTGKIFKVWRSKVFPNDEERVPSIALVTMLYDFSKEKGEEYDYVKSTDTLRDVIFYGIERYFNGEHCNEAANAEINLPVYQSDRNLINKLSSKQRLELCEKLVEFGKALIYSTSYDVSEDNAVKALEPFIGRL